MALTPPGPHDRYPLENTLAVQRDTVKYTYKHWKTYGDIVRIPFLFHTGTMLYHPKHARHVLQQNYSNYDKNISIINALKPLMGNGLFTSNDPYWQHQRKLIQPIFHRSHIQGLSSIITSVVREEAERWGKCSSSQEIIDLPREMKTFTLHLLSQSLFSIKLGEKVQQIEDSTQRMMKALHTYTNLPFPPISIPTPRNKKILQAIKALDEIIYGIIDEHRQTKTYDLLSLLLSARDEQDQPMTNKQIRDEVMTILLGGHDTTAHTLAWIFYVLSEHPNIESKLLSELEPLQGNPPTVEQLRQLPYLDMVISETLRVYTSGFVLARHAKEADEIDGYSIPKNSYIFLLPYYIHRHPDFWENPEIFDPERFSDERKKTIVRSTYLPFGAGPHVCIGTSLADMLMKMTIATLLPLFKARMIPNPPPVVPKVQLSMKPRYGLPMTITAR